MNAIRINGIRVGHQMFHPAPFPGHRNAEPDPLLYRALAAKRINLPCLGVEQTKLGQMMSCCLEQDLTPIHDVRPVCMVSIYPHRSSAEILGGLLSLFGRKGIGFYHMVSSTAMISFVVGQEDKDRALHILEQAFDLPPTHTPYEPEFQEETTAFVKKRYKETRAFFQEEKIKTYGFSLETDLDLTGLRCPLDRLDQTGRQMADSYSKFYFASGLAHSSQGAVSLYWLTRDAGDQDLWGEESLREKADLVSFHGPHFGDRFGIFNAAAACLDAAGIRFWLAGCTGASISLVLPAGLGDAALPALAKGFDTP